MNPLLLDLPDELESERLTLRVPRAGDGAEENAAVRESTAELLPWMPWAQNIPGVEESEARCRRVWADFLARKDIGLHLDLKDTHTLIGGSGPHPLGPGGPQVQIRYLG